MLTGDTPRQEQLFHYTTQAGFEGISASGSINPSADGNVYLTPVLYLDGESAQSFLALSRTPIGYFVIPKADAILFGLPGKVAPANGQPGNGIEIKAPHPVPIRNSTFVRF